MMQERWAVMSPDGEWARDASAKVLTFMVEQHALDHCAELNEDADAANWTVEVFTLEDALEDAARSPFAGEGGL